MEDDNMSPRFTVQHRGNGSMRALLLGIAIGITIALLF
jgi:hypothetical protein